MPRRRKSVPGQEFVVPSALRTTNSNSGAFENWSRGGSASQQPQVRLAITAAVAPTSFILTVQDSPNGTSWTTRDTFPTQTGSATVTRAMPAGLDRYVRVAWTMVGTSFTFSVQFAASTDLLV
jgi:hypothetical protein